MVLTCFSSLAMEARSTLRTDCAISSPTEGWVRELSNSQAEDSICRYRSNSCSQTDRQTEKIDKYQYTWSEWRERVSVAADLWGAMFGVQIKCECV